ncbi:hypothetical protein ACXVUM_13145 [Williamsia sp. SKLECPSW1]
MAELGNLTRARFNGVSAPYKLLVLRWATNRALDGESRLVRLSPVRREIANILSPYRIGTSAPKPSDPWSALDGSSWWERRVTTNGDLGGLSLPVYRLIQEDRGFGRRAIGVLEQLIAETPPTQATTPARLAQAEEPGVSVTPLQIERNLVETFAIEQPGREMTALRREAGLVERYADHLRSKGHKVHRDMIVLGQCLTAIEQRGPLPPKPLRGASLRVNHAIQICCKSRLCAMPRQGRGSCSGDRHPQVRKLRWLCTL